MSSWLITLQALHVGYFSPSSRKSIQIEFHKIYVGALPLLITPSLYSPSYYKHHKILVVPYLYQFPYLIVKPFTHLVGIIKLFIELLEKQSSTVYVEILQNYKQARTDVQSIRLFVNWAKKNYISAAVFC